MRGVRVLMCVGGCDSMLLVREEMDMNKCVVLVSLGCGDKFEMREMDKDEVMKCDVFKSWGEVLSGVWCEESDVVVVGDSEKECLDKLMEFDCREYERVVNSWEIDWVMGLKIDDDGFWSE